MESREYQSIHKGAVIDQAITKILNLENLDQLNSTPAFITQIVTDLANYYYSKSEVYQKMETYTKTEIDNAVNQKADQSNTYTKTETDRLLSDKANQSTTYTKDEVDAKIAAIPKFSIQVVAQLPTGDPGDEISETTVYLVKDTDGRTKNLYEEFIWVEQPDGTYDWESLGKATVKIDLSNYYTKTEIDALIANNKTTFGTITDIQAIFEEDNDNG